MSAPGISFIIPTRDRPDQLSECVQRLLPGVLAQGGCEIIISDDGTSGLPGDWPTVVRIHAGPGKGPGANRNSGARVASGGWLVFLDDDCLPGADLVPAYAAAISKCGDTSPPVLVGPTRRGEGPQESLMWESPFFEELNGLPPSCNFAIRREAFLESGGFDERYRTSFEDMEFFSRLRLAGMPFEMVPGAAVTHPMRPVPGPLSLARRWEARVLSAHDLGATPADIILNLPKHVLAVLISRFREPRIRSHRTQAAVRFAGEYLSFLALLPAWVLKVSRLPRSRFWSGVTARGLGPPRFGL